MLGCERASCFRTLTATGIVFPEGVVHSPLRTTPKNPSPSFADKLREEKEKHSCKNIHHFKKKSLKALRLLETCTIEALTVQPQMKKNLPCEYHLLSLQVFYLRPCHRF